MKKGMGLLLVLFTLVACNNKTKDTTHTQENEPTEEVQAIGGDKDDHGCLVSAGETWSELKQKCLRLFEDGIRLDPVSNEGSAVISAFVVENEDQSKVELFLPEEEQSFILTKKGTHQYEDKRHTFDTQEGVLYIDTQKQYVKSVDDHNEL